jgi:hypothetical protein
MSGMLVQLLLTKGEAMGVRSRRNHEILWVLLSDGRQTGVHGDVSLSRVHVRQSWWRTPTVVGGGVIGSHGGVVGGVATVVLIPTAITPLQWLSFLFWLLLLSLPLSGLLSLVLPGGRDARGGDRGAGSVLLE